MPDIRGRGTRYRAEHAAAEGPGPVRESPRLLRCGVAPPAGGRRAVTERTGRAGLLLRHLHRPVRGGRATPAGRDLPRARRVAGERRTPSAAVPAGTDVEGGGVLRGCGGAPAAGVVHRELQLDARPRPVADRVLRARTHPVRAPVRRPGGRRGACPHPDGAGIAPGLPHRPRALGGDARSRPARPGRREGSDGGATAPPCRAERVPPPAHHSGTPVRRRSTPPPARVDDPDAVHRGACRRVHGGRVQRSTRRRTGPGGAAQLRLRSGQGCRVVAGGLPGPDRLSGKGVLDAMTTTPELSTAVWRKASYSNGDGGECLEVADGLPGLVPVRDSKTPGG